MGTIQISEALAKARAYQQEKVAEIPEGQKPKFHVVPPVGWSNDPNGFSYYNGQYHMFFQNHLYSTSFGPQHWGHAVSDDLITWTYLDTALAPDTPADYSGIFSGSALEVDGKHVLMYTGVQFHVLDKEAEELLKLPDPEHKIFRKLMEEQRIYGRQVQCIAVGDGHDYEKFPENPIIPSDMIPEGLSLSDFRDPKLWKDEEDGLFYAVVGGCDEERDGKLLLYSSEDLHVWKFVSILHDNQKEIGTMWECPDFFLVDGKAVIMASPMAINRDNIYWKDRPSSICVIGSYDREKHVFIEENMELIDHGSDYYAPTSMGAPDGRRIQVGWMGSFQNRVTPMDYKWIGGLTLPREIHIRDGKLYQLPVQELANHYANEVKTELTLNHEKTSVDGISGRYLDLTVKASAGTYRKLSVTVLSDEDGEAVVTYDRDQEIVSVDRSSCQLTTILGPDKEPITYAPVPDGDGSIELRIIIDNAYVEVYVNGGAQAFSSLVFKGEGKDAIYFEADGEAALQIIKEDLVS